MQEFQAWGLGGATVSGTSQGLPTCAPKPMQAVPALREDLTLHSAAPDKDGSPAWMIHDTVSNRFCRIGWLEFELLSRWSLKSPSAILAGVLRDTVLQPTGENLQGLIEFLQAQQLLRADSAQASALLARMAAKQSDSKGTWLLHNYLFFRLPLVRPDRFLSATLPYLNGLFSKTFALFTLACTLLGLLLVARQWDTFSHTFTDFLSLKGFAGYAAALALAKCFHELGHAYTATRYGVRVAHMGVAFLVMWPMLYTDTSESWKLIDRRKRFNIAAAGVTVELAIAGFATLAWSLVDDGALRSALFFLATASWIITIGINASPFMRFDGYFLLSDALDMPNLHLRSGAMARAWLRRRLLGWDEPWPETTSNRERRWLVAFALVTWLYRFVVFMGIAAAVYYFFFKALGIFLFVVEVVWFIAKPIYTELAVWFKQRTRTSRKASLFWLLGLGLMFLALLLPWRTSIHADALLRSEQQAQVFSPLPARISSIRAAGPVKAGDIVAILESPEARNRAVQSMAGATALATALDQTIGRADGADSRAQIQEQLGERLAEVKAQNNEIARLSLRAGFDGVLLDTDPLMKPGVWINSNQPLAMLIDPNHWVIEALVEQRDLARIKLGSEAKFLRRGSAQAPLKATVTAIDSTRVQTLPHVMLATEHGGRVAARYANADGSEGDKKSQSGNGLSPRDSLYRVRLKLATESGVQALALQAGSVSIEGQSRSILGDWFTTIAAVLVRESGF
jgi:putative peptide zinc metalloprotease protein